MTGHIEKFSGRCCNRTARRGCNVGRYSGRILVADRAREPSSGPLRSPSRVITANCASVPGEAVQGGWAATRCVDRTDELCAALCGSSWRPASLPAANPSGCSAGAGGTRLQPPATCYACRRAPISMKAPRGTLLLVLLAAAAVLSGSANAQFKCAAALRPRRMPRPAAGCGAAVIT